MQISETIVWSVLCSITGLFIVVLGSYVAYVIGTLKKIISEQREDYRDYKRDIALEINKIYDRINDNKSSLDRVSVRMEDICREHERNHK